MVCNIWFLPCFIDFISFLILSGVLVKIHAPGGSWWNHQMICIDTMAGSQTNSLPFSQGTLVTPSGYLPSEQDSPDGTGLIIQFLLQVHSILPSLFSVSDELSASDRWTILVHCWEVWVCLRIDPDLLFLLYILFIFPKKPNHLYLTPYTLFFSVWHRFAFSL